MIFVFILSLILLSEFVFFYGIYSFFPLLGLELAAFQLLVFVVSIFFLFKNFRRKQTTNYRPAFNSFGVMIASGVPSLPFLPFGIAYFFVPEKLVLTIGLVLSFLLFIGIIYGILHGRWNWKVNTIRLNWNDLPDSLNGKRIVQISDIHVGSFFDKHGRVEKAIDMINEQDADYVFFTGDLVNNLAAEMKGWEPVFSKIKSKKGKY
ncbi:MAG: metallophosphoesterase, partial [Fluviicola sp.]